MGLVFAGDLAGRPRLDRRGCRGRLLGTARAPDRERHLLQHDRGLSKCRRSRSGRASGRTKGSAGCVARPWAAIPASVACIAPSSSGSTAAGPRPSRRRARPARSSSASGSWMPSATPRTRWARFACGWATWTRPARPSTARTSTDTTHSPGSRSCTWPAVRSTRPNARSDARSPRRPAPKEPPTERPGHDCSRPRSTSRSRPATSRRPARRSMSWSRSRPTSSDPCSKPARSRPAASCSWVRIGPSDASPLLGRSWRLWQDTELPYESARARLRYAEAEAAEGDPEGARRDLRAARSAFERLGARRDLARVDALLGEGAESAAHATQRVTRTLHVHRHRHVDRPRRADRR